MSQDKPKFDPESTIVQEHSVVAGVGRPLSSPSLSQVQGPRAPREFLLSDETVLGRSHHANVCIDSSLLSRRHAEIRRSGPEFRLTDLQSANGVYLNGVRIHSAVLHEGDTIQIGDAVFLFHEGGK